MAVINGTSNNDTLNGTADADSINGGTGADTMVGGAGNDTYVVDDAGDVVEETGVLPAGVIKLASVAKNGTLGNDSSYQFYGFSPDGGRIAFASSASNLIAGDTNGFREIFIKDLATGTITRVNTSVDGKQANNYSYGLAFSPDGTKVVFTSAATNLVANADGYSLFIKDLTTGAVTPLSSGFGAVFSPDGSKVAFLSGAYNIVAGDNNSAVDVFIRDLTTGVTTRESTNKYGGQGNSVSYSVAFTPDGNNIVFESLSNNLVTDDTNEVSDVFIKNLTTGIVTRVSTATDGTQGNGESGDEFFFSQDRKAAVSPDGKKIAFISKATNLVAGDSNGISDVFVKDLITGVTTRVNTTATGLQANGESYHLKFSPDSSKLIFDSYASNLVFGDNNDGVLDVFIKDLNSGAIIQLAPTTPNGQNSLSASEAFFSADSSKIGFISADPWVAGDSNGFTDVYVKYLPESLGDIGVEDTVLSSISYTLSANLEHLTLQGTAAIAGTGNISNNLIIGNSAANRLTGLGGNDSLDGGGGSDTLVGGTGYDTYVVDAAGDVVIEDSTTATEIDIVQSAVSYTLGLNLENLTLTGTRAINGTGNSLVNALTGNSAANVLNGEGGADTLVGGTGNDTYVVDNTSDVVIETSTKITEVDVVMSSVSYTLSSNIETLVLTGTAAINGVGNGRSNLLIGNSAANLLESGWANWDDGLVGDTMKGGLGDDTYRIYIMDTVIENNNEGIDTVYVYFSSYTLGDNLENLELYDSDWNTERYFGTGNALANVLMGGNVLDGGIGADTLKGGLGNDTYIVDQVGDVVFEETDNGVDVVRSEVSYTLSSNVESLVLTGTLAVRATGNTGANTLTGNSLANVLTGLGGNDWLDGDVGDDTLIGGSGKDSYIVDSQDDVVIETSTVLTEIDVVLSTISYTLGSTLESLVLIGTMAIDGMGNALGNAITGNNEVNLLNGGGGADTLAGGTGNDIYVVDNTGDVVKETSTLSTERDTVLSGISYTLVANLENLVLTGTMSLNGIGNLLNNMITGNSAGNLLDGGRGTDTLTGGAGNDTYIVDDYLFVDGNATSSSTWSADMVVEDSTASAGIDTVLSWASYRLAANIENLVLLEGGGANWGIGNELANLLTGNKADNYLSGEAGADTMIGGLGDDTYVIDNQGDFLVENADSGYSDKVISAISYTLTDNVENLTLSDNAGAINGTGNSLNNVLAGNVAANLLDGGAGADTMRGGAGNDTYVVDNERDTVSESFTIGSEIDTVLSSISFTLSDNVEKLVLTGTTALGGTGNWKANTLTGNSAANRLDGGLGADTLIGGAGDDTYIVDNAGDIIKEASAAGVDTVQSSVSFVLGAGVENLVLTEISALNGSGNGLKNVLRGNSYANLLDGGVGADTMNGGFGSDTYVVDNAADIVVENTGIVIEVDVVQSSVSYILSANVENLTLMGTSALRGTGNVLANIMIGNSAANVLLGDAGNDVLIGGAGADTLVGGTGSDTYIVEAAGDVIKETSTLATDLDIVQSSISYTLGANLEGLVLTGTAALNGTGNGLANMLTGNSANNLLDGAGGADEMRGGLGNDTYLVDNIGDKVVETSSLAGEMDTVLSAVSYTLDANLETLVLTGTMAFNATGNSLANTLTGNSVANVLNGGAGADTLTGGAGSDTYVVDSSLDIVIESSTLLSDVDLVQSAVSYTLGANLEQLQLTGIWAINAVGNELANKLTGNMLGNLLDGGAGNDTLAGGSNHDTYIIDSEADVIIEQDGGVFGGVDFVLASVSYTLSANLEHLFLTGSASVNGSGNGLNNLITGTSAANRLDGGAGVDSLAGGSGSDTYIVDNSQDSVFEDSTVAGEVDTVLSSASYALGDGMAPSFLANGVVMRQTEFTDFS